MNKRDTKETGWRKRRLTRRELYRTFFKLRKRLSVCCLPCRRNSNQFAMQANKYRRRKRNWKCKLFYFILLCLLNYCTINTRSCFLVGFVFSLHAIAAFALFLYTCLCKFEDKTVKKKKKKKFVLTDSTANRARPTIPSLTSPFLSLYWLVLFQR